ncbi:MAG TPA: hypothetical protein DCM32_08650 [Xanthomonadaceae bacterium]|nr:hypothetical protein [Xanthomonadaceae bacterium]
MSQRIDLYRDDLRPHAPSGELRRNLVLIGVMVAALLVWGGLSQWSAATRGAELERLSAEQAALQASMATATEQLSQRAPDPALTAALVEAQFAVDGRRWLADQLQGVGDGSTTFSAVLEGLGRQRPEPLWLTRIHIDQGGDDLGLAGRSLDAALVPAYLERLAREPALQGREFSHFWIERPESGVPALAFEMATHCRALAAGCDDRDTRGEPR